MKVFILDDHPERCEGLKTLLRQIDRHAHFAQASNWKQVLRTLEFGLPDLFIIDWQLNWIHTSAIMELLSTYPTLQIAIFTEDLSSMDVHQLLHAGVLGILPRDLDPHHVLRALELVLWGGRYIPSGALNLNLPNENRPAGKNITTLPKPSLRHAKGVSRLSPRQHQIIRFLHMGSTNKMMARALNISEGTVKIHLSTIYRLLGATNRASAVAFYNNWQFERQKTEAPAYSLQNHTQQKTFTLLESNTVSDLESLTPVKPYSVLLNKTPQNDHQQRMIAQTLPAYSSGTPPPLTTDETTKNKKDR